MSNERVPNVVYNVVRLISETQKIANQWFIDDIIKDCAKKHEESDDVEVELLVQGIKEDMAEHFPVSG